MRHHPPLLHPGLCGTEPEFSFQGATLVFWLNLALYRPFLSLLKEETPFLAAFKSILRFPFAFFGEMCYHLS